jgi:hypothetical protein
MIVAVTGFVWVFFSVLVGGSLLIMLWYALRLLRRLKEFGVHTRKVTEDLNTAMASVNEQLEQATEGMARVTERRLRKR